MFGTTPVSVINVSSHLMLLTLMEEWGILGREGSCTATAR